MKCGTVVEEEGKHIGGNRWKGCRERLRRGVYERWGGREGVGGQWRGNWEGMIRYIKNYAFIADLWSHCSRSWAVLQLKYFGPPLLGVTWKQWGRPRRLGCNGVTAARSIEVTAWPHRRDSCDRQPRRPAPRCFCLSSFVTLFVLFSGFDRNDLFEKKFCNRKNRILRLFMPL